MLIIRDYSSDYVTINVAINRLKDFIYYSQYQVDLSFYLYLE